MTFTTGFYRIAGSLVVVFGLGMPATAQTNAIGTVEATIDGVAYRGETLEVPSEGTATAEFMAIGPMTTVTVQAHDPEADSIMHNVLSVELMMEGTELAGPMMPPTVSYWPEGMRAAFYIMDETGTAPEITIDDVSLVAGEAFIRGSFTAQACKQESFFSEIDLDDCITIEGSFDTPMHETSM
ncbi:MAG: hypothetical protein ACNA7O_05425 [Rhodobacterales bacterium]